jgi:hypothetical protein
MSKDISISGKLFNQNIKKGLKDFKKPKAGQQTPMVHQTRQP